jgi:hypothetical protein
MTISSIDNGGISLLRLLRLSHSSTTCVVIYIVWVSMTIITDPLLKTWWQTRFLCRNPIMLNSNSSSIHALYLARSGQHRGSLMDKCRSFTSVQICCRVSFSVTKSWLLNRLSYAIARHPSWVDWLLLISFWHNKIFSWNFHLIIRTFWLSGTYATLS